MAEKEYQRLTRAKARPGLAVALLTRSSLWLGKDHLLVIDSNGFTETYKRFYFRDIQAITVHVTSRRAYWNWLLGIPAAVFALGGIPYVLLNPSAGTGAIITVSVIAAVFCLPLLVNNLFGPSCLSRIKTAVQTEDLPSLNRLRSTRTVLNRIRPLITQAQGEITAAEMLVLLREPSEALKSTPMGAATQTAMNQEASSEPQT